MTDAALLPELGGTVLPQLFRALAGPITTDVVARLREAAPFAPAEVDEYAEHCQLLPVATRAAVRGFLDPDTSIAEHRKIGELFKRLGYGEAQCGRPVDRMQTALRLAMACAWEHLADHAVSQQYSAKTLRDIGVHLRQYVEQLDAHLLEGHDHGSGFARRSRTAARARLLEVFGRAQQGRLSLLRGLGMDPEQLRQLAGEAGWPLPERVVAVAVTYYGEPPELPDRPEVLGGPDHDRVVALCPEAQATALVAELGGSGSDRRVAMSWPVNPEESGSALGWAARALDLVRLGVIPPTPVVSCADHVTQLWLHAEPSMRQRMCQELLEPLLAESPNSREILSDTLLAWLETRDSAPAIAARLDVHPQTVRYRWKRINELFGESLHDPEFVLQVTLVLKSSVLMWKAGNREDFERFRDRQATDA
jgi:hypothetical protein